VGLVAYEMAVLVKRVGPHLEVDPRPGSGGGLGEWSGKPTHPGLRERRALAEDRSVSRAETPPDDTDGTPPAPGWVRGVGSVAVLTGAGISTDSGMPDLDARGCGYLDV